MKRVEFLYPAVLAGVGGGLIVGGLIAFFSVSVPNRKDFKELQEKTKQREKIYIKQMDSLSQVNTYLYENYYEEDDSVIHINEIRDETLDSIIGMPSDSVLKFLTDRFNSGS